MTVVVPMLLNNLLEAGRPLPWPTRVLKGASDLLLVSHGGVLALAMAAVLIRARIRLADFDGEQIAGPRPSCAFRSWDR